MTRSRNARQAAALAAVCAVASAATAEVPQPDPNLRAGGIESRQTDQPGSRIRRGHAEGIVNAPADRVMAVIQDYANYYRFMPHFETSRVLARRGSSALLYVQVTALHGLARLWAEVKVGARQAPAPAQRIEARMTRGNLKQFEATWQITPLSANQTLVAFELCADPNLPIASTAGIVSDQNEKEARSSIQALREYVAGRNPRAP
jgi:ribosome-associated toxin RatA of RatAB toxin-antitoxin module